MTLPREDKPVLWTSTEADAATGGHSTRAWEATGVSIDSRTIQPGDLFIAIRGPNLDGHQFVGAAIEGGAAAGLVSRIPRDVGAGAPLIIVDDTYTGLEKLACAARRRADAGRVAITGSVGKTSTKEALAAALRASGPTCATEGNLNNLWGVPLSLARMPRDMRYGVFEIGMNHAGEITPLSRMVRPQVAIITTVEAVHLEFFDSMDGIAGAKAEIFDGLDRKGTAVINRDNRFHNFLVTAAEQRGIRNIVSFGEHEDADVRLVSYESGRPARITAEVMGERLDFAISLPGRHQALNAMAVLAAVKVLGADLRGACDALGAMDAPAGRGKRLTIALPEVGTVTVIDDSYNASPASMRAAFKVLGQSQPGTGGRRIAVLGDMLELGPESLALHSGLAEPLVAAAIDLVFCCGPSMRALFDALPAERRGLWEPDSQSLAGLVAERVRPGDVVLVKGSLGSRMARVIDRLSAGASPSAARA